MHLCIRKIHYTFIGYTFVLTHSLSIESSSQLVIERFDGSLDILRGDKIDFPN